MSYLKSFFSYKNPSSDHFVHLNMINKYRENNFQINLKNINYFNQKYHHYPFFFHWILSKYFFKTVVNYPLLISYAINVLSFIFFNLFLSLVKNDYNFYELFLLNVIKLIFPFSYIYWNAKNLGISGRAFGVLLGELFSYGLFFLVNYEDNFYVYVYLYIIGFISLISSLFTFQFVYLISLIISIFLNNPILFALMNLLFPGLILIFPNYGKDFIKGQLNHKINYSKYLAKVKLLKERKSIYRDFIYDFWVKMFLNFKKGLKYIFKNPIVEVIYGFPFLIIYLFNIMFSNSSEFSIDLVILSSLILFLLICLRPFRFLGEPQRYIEFIIPLISILFIKTTNPLIINLSILLSLVIIFLLKEVNKVQSNSGEERQSISDYLINNFDKDLIITSNHVDYVKDLVPYFKVLKIDLTKKYNSENEFKFFIKNDYTTHSVEGLIDFNKNFKIDLLIIKKELYTDEENKILFNNIKASLIKAFDEYEIYKIKK